ncbi:cytochrome c oxidase subunit I [Rhizobiales bacterium RZME27]|uniref:cytochrome-c oxidase n=1 Tax=Endobacterium cereale TaxID=2663029 RepID=A0A6A8ACW3_9HYPH|nr:cytochrome c oxidase subunit I [Endobacterium cereale]MEB2846702.1 cytochrome c oxidase subunit I [Endobacterium cereale]MQY46581.1 cytochrome c oxidase subunit I [Endobacterium cereale]
MSEKITSDHNPIALHRALERIWGTRPGWGRLAAVNHNVIGVRFMLTALVFFAIGGILAMLIRTQLASAESVFMDAETYAQVFTMHGSIMMFLFAIPFFEGMAIYLLPKLLGTRDLAFPRLGAYGYWCYLFGGLILIGALIGGVAPDSGWFMYTPLSSSVYAPGINSDIWLLGITFVEISALSAAVEIIVTIMKIRAAGMSIDRIPIFAWYMLVVATMMLVGFPPLILGSILLEVERAFDLPFFDPTRGGDPLLWQHLFWLFGHPEVYIIFLPAAGAISTILPVLAGTPLAGYRMIVAAIVSMAFLSFGLWVHHMYTVGIPHVALSFFSAASALVAVPTAIQTFAWLATIAHGRPRFSIPMLHIFGFFFVFVIGGLTGVMLAMVPFDWQAHDTHFVVAHLHYVLVGGFVFPMLAMAYYWVPHLSGKQPVQHLSHAAFWMVFIGFNVTFFFMHLTGLLGMPRRIFEYPAGFGWETLNFISSMGSFLMAMGFALVALDFILLFKFGRPFRRNPWRAGTLEWAMPTPPPSYNFASIARIDNRADLLDPDRIGPRLAAGDGYLGIPRHDRMEVLGVDPISGEPDQVVELPRQTYLPLWTALATGAFFLLMLFKLYWLIPLALAVVIGCFWLWTVCDGSPIDREPVSIGHGLKVPVHIRAQIPPSHLAMVLTLVANATLYISLLFGCLFLWVSAPNWPPKHVSLDMPLLVLAAVASVLTCVGNRLASRRTNLATVGNALSLCAHLLSASLFLWVAFLTLPAPSGHAAIASLFVVMIYAALHGMIGAIFAAHAIWRALCGHDESVRSLDLRIGRLWHDYSAAAAICAVGFCWNLQILIAGSAP